MNHDSCYRVGYVIKKHGLKGDVKIYLESPLPKKTKVLYINQDNNLIPFFVEHISILNNIAIIKLEDITTPEGATELSGTPVYLPKETGHAKQETPLENTLGYSVVHQGQHIGLMKEIILRQINPLFVVRRLDKEILIPIHEHFIKKIEHDKKTITVELPEGFINL